MKYSRNYYKGKIREMIDNDKGAYSIFYAVDKMFHVEIKLPDELQEMDDIRLIKDSSPHDALYNATVALANSQIGLTVTPLGNAQREFERANEIEQALQWNWRRANMRGMSRKIWDIAHSALRYDLAVTRVDDLMFHLPKDKNKWTKANKRAARAGRFVLNVLPPHKVHFRMSEMAGAFCVLSARNLPLTKVLDYYESIAGTDDVGKRMLQGVSDLKQEYQESSDLEDARFMLFQYTDDDCRFEFGHIADDESDESIVEEFEAGSVASDYVFVETDNQLPFMNYTVRGGASEVEPDSSYIYHPMLASAHWSDTWKNTVLSKSLVFSDILRRLREIRGTYEGAAAEMVPPDDGTGGDKALPPGTSYRRQPATQLDPQAIQLIQGLANDLAATTSATALGNLSRYSNTAFSTMNAIVQVEMGKLNPQKNIIQDTIADECMLFCEWVKYTGMPLQAWRTDAAQVGEREIPRGAEIQIGPDDYDLDRLFIACLVTPETPTDQMQQVNITEKLVQFGMSKEEALERMNVPHASLQQGKSHLEILKDGIVQAVLQKITTLQVGEAQAQVQMLTAEAQAAQQAQQQAQQQEAMAGGMMGGGGMFPGMMGGEMPPEGPGAFEGLEGAGFNPAEGGMPPMTGAPGMGREQMEGVTPNGLDLGVG